MGYVFLCIAFIVGISFNYFKSLRLKIFISVIPIILILIYYIFLPTNYQHFIDSYFILINFMRGH